MTSVVAAADMWWFPLERGHYRGEGAEGKGDDVDGRSRSSCFRAQESRSIARSSGTLAPQPEWDYSMQSVAFFNNKGGVGKTTLLCNVAAFCALRLSKSVIIVDADPQCNATQYLFDEQSIEKIYGPKGFTVHDIIEPLREGEGFTRKLGLRKSESFGVDVLPGDPKLALIEDFLAQDWSQAKSGDIRGMKTSLVFAELFGRLSKYDYVFVDVSPSLGAINRSILLAADYFVSPMSIDIFSLKAFENISIWLETWGTEWERGKESVREGRSLPDLSHGQVKFLGYVTQQYLAKRDPTGTRRGVAAYEKIRGKIDGVISDCGLDKSIPGRPFEIGTVPNLFSLIPMSQSNNTPVFELSSKDGVRGAHFAKVRDATEIFEKVTNALLERLS